jgi:hypothetical protein
MSKAKSKTSTVARKQSLPPKGAAKSSARPSYILSEMTARLSILAAAAERAEICTKASEDADAAQDAALKAEGLASGAVNDTASLIGAAVHGHTRNDALGALLAVGAILGEVLTEEGDTKPDTIARPLARARHILAEAFGALADHPLSRQQIAAVKQAFGPICKDAFEAEDMAVKGGAR